MKHRSSGKLRPPRLFLLIGGLWLLPLLAWVGCQQGGPESSRPYVERLQNTQLEGPGAEQVQYVGGDGCRGCHLGKSVTFATTGMGRSFGTMVADEIRADFVDNNRFVDSASGLHYVMTVRDGVYYQREFLQDERGQPYNETEFPLKFWIGSANHNRGYMIEREGRLFQAPICWYPQPQSWDLCPGFDQFNEHFAREVSQSCVFCHNATMVVLDGERNRFPEPIPHGIDCERCHGPGSLHVDRWSAGDETPGGGVDTTIVHPRRLTASQRNEICYQCHLGDARSTERVARLGAQLVDYRPGRPLVETLVPFRYSQPTKWDFGLSAQADRMMHSACFTESEGKLECVTCHDPHVSVYHPDRPADLFNQRCLTCHEIDSCAADTMESDCVQCHMRRAEPDDQRMTAFTDHWIRTRIDLDEKDSRSDFSIEPIFPESFAELSAGEQAFHEARALSLLAGEAPPVQQTLMREQAEQLYGTALAEGLDHRDVHFFRGSNQFSVGQFEAAQSALRRVLEQVPQDAEAAFMLGQIVLSQGKLDEAQELFNGILANDPDHVGALAEAGRVEFAMGRKDEAEGRFRRAADLEPENSDLQISWGMVLASRGELEDAAERAEIAVRLNPDSTETWSFYVNVMRSLGRTSALRRGESRLAELGR